MLARSLSLLLLAFQVINTGPNRVHRVSGGGGGSCTLGYTTNLAVRLEANNITSCSGAISSWPDTSGNANNAAMSGSPTCNSTNGPGGTPSVTLNGSSQSGTLATDTYNSVGNTVYAVVYPTTVSKGKLTDAYGAFSVWVGDGTALKYGADSGETAAIGSGTTALTANAWQQFNVSYDGTTAYFRRNSAADGSATPGAVVTTPMRYLFFDHSDTSEFYNGRIAALLIYVEASTTANKQTVESYLRCAYGVS